MISYKDMTFCNARCANEDCDRRLTQKIIDQAAKWWGSDDAPIAVANFSLTCLRYKPMKTQVEEET